MRAVPPIRPAFGREVCGWLLLAASIGAGMPAARSQEALKGRPANPHGRLSIPCENCHTTTAWKPIRRQPEFNHDTQTSFPLRGLHQGVACTSCHASLVFADAPVQCSECHADLHRRQFGSQCDQCHSVRGWKVGISAIQDHNNRFPLLGAHLAATCDDCHHGAATGVYTGLSTQCAACHLANFQHAASLNHVAAGLPATCENCHGVNTWEGARFDHAQIAKFALTGAHAALACAQCHAGNRFAGTPTDCAGCHVNDFTSTQNPNHTAAAFPQDCSLCHTTLTWAGAAFNHNTFTSFALTGAHSSVTCAQCHVAGKFAGTATACAGCHLQDFANTTNPNHRTSDFSTSCEACHNTTGWQNANFDHSQSRFPLTGAHMAVACAQCHVNGNFSTLPVDCSGCHLADFQKTTTPNHVTSGFSQDCKLCHTTAQWNGATFDHATTGFALAGAHASLQCAQCHVNNNFSLSSASCITCHLTDFHQANNPPHQTAGFPQDCTMCHKNMTDWSGAVFDHTSTGFALTGAHNTVQCAQCHVNNNFSLSGGACINCHLADFNNTNNPPHKSGGFPQDCTGCHTTTTWLGATFNHATTGFALTGAHNTLQCAQCHVNNNFSLSGGGCWNCHQADYNGTNNPPHQAANFPQDCSGCHTTTTWLGATFNHATTGFALVGAHTSLQCAQCHVNNNFSLSSGACINCHLADFNNTNDPPHKQAGFPQDCSVCHKNMTDWSGATFDHSTTGFALTGAHNTLQCTQCHVNNNFSLSSGACWNCHQTDYNGTNNPPHKTSGFPQDCSGCHTTTTWLGATFNHTTTGFALTGAHNTLQCAQCHVNNNFSLSGGGCWNCHQTDYNGTNNPPHKAANFPQDCSGCHTTTDWSGATFNHASTGFALTGAHTSLQCAQCHVNNNFSFSSGACWNCHQTDYNGTNNPPHKSSGFPQDCSGCHTTATWLGATFNHATTGFALVGAHTSLQCAQCHVNNNFNLSSGACWNCHQADYNNTNNPPHKSANFPQDCTQCHSNMNDWSGAVFNHASTGFALVGVHASQQCTACHVNNNYSLSSAACWNCHQTDYNNTNNPPHQAAGFPQDCTLCHGSAALNWTSATFNHSSTGFALTGAHTNLQCAQCHVNNNFALTSGACWNCHQTDYNNTTNPPHKASGFPQDCSGCHTTTDWSGATFNHATTGFTLTGAHTALQCAQCHVNNNFSLTSAACWNCHQADYNGTTNPAHQAAGFPQDCSTCHSTTNWSGATFTHPSSPMQLTGYHATMLANNQCSQCHVGNNYTSTPTDCWSCHQTDFQNTTNPGHVAANFAHTCDSCHTFTDWTGARYAAHDTKDFPIYSGTHQGKWQNCTDCHPSSSDYTLATMTCISCHQHSNQAQVTSDHQGVKGFVYNSAMCYQCHPQGRGGN